MQIESGIMLHATHLSVLILPLILCLGQFVADAETISLKSLDAFNVEVCGRASANTNSRRSGRQTIVTRRRLTQSAASELRRRIDFINRFRHKNDRLTPHNPKWMRSASREASSRAALVGEAPWYVSLQTYFDYSDNPDEVRRPRCAGTLIHSDLVLTAAHCLRRGKYTANKQSYALAGFHEWNQTKTLEPIRFAKMCLPPDYRPLWSRNATQQGRDFALIKLEKPFQYGQFVQPACMYDLSSCGDASEKRNCKAAGFGHQMIGFRPTQLAAVSMRACWLAELKPHRPDELCFVDEKKEAGELNVIDRGSGIYCRNTRTNGTYVVGVSTVNIQPLETVCCVDKPQQAYYTDLFRWRRELAELIETCL